MDLSFTGELKEAVRCSNGARCVEDVESYPPPFFDADSYLLILIIFAIAPGRIQTGLLIALDGGRCQ